MALTLGLQWFQQWESTHYCHPILRASLCTAMKKWAQIIIEVCRLLENTSSLIWTRKIIAHFSNQTRRPKHDSAQKFSTEKLLTQISNETKGNHHHDQNGQCRVRNSVKAAGEFWSPKRKKREKPFPNSKSPKETSQHSTTQKHQTVLSPSPSSPHLGETGWSPQKNIGATTTNTTLEWWVPLAAKRKNESIPKLGDFAVGGELVCGGSGAGDPLVLAICVLLVEHLRGLVLIARLYLLLRVLHIRAVHPEVIDQHLARLYGSKEDNKLTAPTTPYSLPIPLCHSPPPPTLFASQVSRAEQTTKTRSVYLCVPDGARTIKAEQGSERRNESLKNTTNPAASVPKLRFYGTNGVRWWRPRSCNVSK